ncbi:hypothetical protein [Legionella longbeachae]|uniref:Uncharacterized protein n=1 Tax=Legionella longbeachae serogroup 1 (strain NSW150) TaxID=661367 RepID=D3HJI2_LEGLN|nr:hypothetical protein [Legionella longbeachae]VEE03111.1 Uncharacterised protein [Legionella oakridgensis]HBD7399230.1 hypothetical protein [Legionella pneumophila]EEZ94316.1 hypothetical protein LLB_3221 [Legionella longbeachae D-4968]UAK46132.1 hypothetical protein K8O86_15395 [Legionella longbeachae]CBJ12575.1 protein of unknown function [Legionella longbeachae NSW150]
MNQQIPNKVPKENLLTRKEIERVKKIDKYFSDMVDEYLISHPPREITKPKKD